MTCVTPAVEAVIPGKALCLGRLLYGIRHVLVDSDLMVMHMWCFSELFNVLHSVWLTRTYKNYTHLLHWLELGPRRPCGFWALAPARAHTSAGSARGRLAGCCG